jgi:hypothetical protein
MPEYVTISVIRTDFEEHGIWAIPLIYDLLDGILVVVYPEPDRAFVGTPASVRLDAKPHLYLRCGIDSK